MNNQELEEEDDEKKFGTTLSLSSILPENISCRNTLYTIDPRLEFNKNRTPLVKLLAEEYCFVGGRRDFKIFRFKWQSSIVTTKASKSKFFDRGRKSLQEKSFDYELIFSSIDRAVELEKFRLEEERNQEMLKNGIKLDDSQLDSSEAQLRRVQQLQFAAKLRDLKEGIRPGYHCVCHLKVRKSGKQYLILGGNHNVGFHCV